MNITTSNILPSINNTSHWISKVFCSLSYQNAKNFDCSFEVYSHKKITLNSNLEQSQCITMLILFLIYIKNFQKGT